MCSYWDRDRDNRDSRIYHNRDRFSDRERDHQYLSEGRRSSYSGGSWESSSRHRVEGRNWDERDRGKQQQLEQRGSGGRERPPHPPLLSPPSHRIGRPDDYIREDSRRNSVTKSTFSSAAAQDLLPPPPPPAPTDSARNSVSSTSTARPLDHLHNSPRERGMLDPVPGIAGQHRRQSSHNSSSSLGWTRGKEDQRDRGEIENSRRGSLDRAPDRYGDSPTITESPLSYAPPLASPATPVSTGMAPHQTVDTRMSSTIPPADSKGLAFSRFFQESSYAYMKARETYGALKVAESERNQHSEHFASFPVMRERYEGNFNKAKRDHALAEENLKEKSEPLDRICTELARENLSMREVESVASFARQLKRDIGEAPSLSQFVKSIAQAQQSQSSIKPADFDRLSKDLKDLRKRQDDDERIHQEFAAEFRSFKAEQESRFQQQERKLEWCEIEIGRCNQRMERCENFQQTLQSDIERTREDLMNALQIANSARDTAKEVQESSRQLVKDGIDTVMAEATSAAGPADTETGSLEEVLKSLESLQRQSNTVDEELQTTTARFTGVDSDLDVLRNETKELQGRLQKLELEVPDLRARTASVVTPTATLPEDYPCKADIHRLEQQIQMQDETIDTIRKSMETDIDEILNQIQLIEQKHHETSTQGSEDLAAFKTSSMFEQATLRQALEEQKGHLTRFHAHLERLTGKATKAESCLEGHRAAIQHVDQRMSSFTTKEFYERVVQNLVSINPLLFNSTSQLQQFGTQLQLVTADVKKLAIFQNQQLQRQNQANQPPPPVAAREVPSPTEGSSGIARLNYIAQFIKKLESHVSDLDTRLTEHINVYNTKISDIREWTNSATQQMADNSESAALIMDEVKRLRAFLDTLRRSGSPQSGVGSAADRWRAVSTGQETAQGLLENRSE